MERRGFLGSVIGLAIGSTQGEFLARTFNEPASRVETLDLCYFHDAVNNVWVKPPALKEIQYGFRSANFDWKHTVVRYVFEPIEVTQQICFDKCKVLGIGNNIILNRKIMPKLVLPGDVLCFDLQLEKEEQYEMLVWDAHIKDEFGPDVISYDYEEKIHNKLYKYINRV